MRGREGTAARSDGPRGDGPHAVCQGGGECGYTLGAMRRPSTRICSPLLALALCLGCKPTKDPLAPTDNTTDGTTGGQGGGQTMAPLAKVTRAVELFSPRTLVVVESAGPARVAEILGRDQLVARFPDEHRDLVEGMVREIGIDALDPKALASIGVDIEGRIGVAVLSAKPFTWAFYWSVSDPGKFRKHVVDRLRAKGQEVSTVPMSGAELLRVDGMRAGLVLRGPVAVFVGQDGEVKGDPALEVATADPYASLANDRGYRKATGGVAPGDGSIFANVGLLWALARPEEGELPPPVSNWAKDELEQAKARGDSKERIAELEAQAREMDASEKRWADRRKAERELGEWIIGRTGLSMWSGMAKPGGIFAVGKLEIDPESGPSKLMRNRAGAPALAKALARDPAIMITGALEPGEVTGFLDLALRSQGASWNEAIDEVKKTVGVDLETEVRPLFTGAGGFAATIDGEFTGDRKIDRKLPGLAIDLEVADATKARAMLDKVAVSLEAERVKRKDKTFALRRDKRGGWVMDFPEWRPLYVSVAGHHLVASSDPDLAGRIATGKEGPGGRKRASALAAASLPGSAFSGLLDVAAFGMFTMVGTSEFAFAETMVAESPDDAKVPKSKAHKAKLAELAKAQTTLNAERAVHQLEENKAIIAMFEPWGALAGSITEDGSGLLARGGLFLEQNNGLSGALLDSLVAFKAMQTRRDTPPTHSTFAEVDRLRAEAEEIRRRDVDAWRVKHNKGKPHSVPIPEVGVAQPEPMR